MQRSLLVATLCLASGLACAAPPGGPGGPDDRGPQQGGHAPAGQAQGPGQQRDHLAPGQQQAQQRGGPPVHNGRVGGPPQDLGPARERIQALRGEIGRGGPLPPNVHVERGRPLPRGYGRPLPPHVVQQLPAYPGYEWRRLGPDMVLIAVGTGIVYEILQGVLN